MPKNINPYLEGRQRRPSSMLTAALLLASGTGLTLIIIGTLIKWLIA